MARALLRASLTSGGLQSLGDILCQRIAHRDEKREFQLDFARTARFAAAGTLLHGPMFHHAFRLVDTTAAKLTLSRMQGVLYKTCVLQLGVFPIYLSALFPAMGMMEGKSFNESVKRATNLVPKAFTAGLMYWPLANIVNFTFVPLPNRLAFGASLGVAWNVILSYINSNKTQLPFAGGQQGKIAKGNN
mmetsp:Transcript_6271/g.18918  ORF Transcript_6271/g.18918 Transcript_6271/m.18918 type:complete len:189 (-) Transcript_6271:2873-3439(-)